MAASRAAPSMIPSADRCWKRDVSTSGVVLCWLILSGKCARRDETGRSLSICGCFKPARSLYAVSQSWTSVADLTLTAALRMERRNVALTPALPAESRPYASENRLPCGQRASRRPLSCILRRAWHTLCSLPLELEIEAEERARVRAWRGTQRPNDPAR